MKTVEGEYLVELGEENGLQILISNIGDHEFQLRIGVVILGMLDHIGGHI